MELMFIRVSWIFGPKLGGENRAKTGQDRPRQGKTGLRQAKTRQDLAKARQDRNKERNMSRGTVRVRGGVGFNSQLGGYLPWTLDLLPRSVAYALSPIFRYPGAPFFCIVFVDAFWDRLLVDFASQLGSNLGPKIDHTHSKNRSQKASTKIIDVRIGLLFGSIFKPQIGTQEPLKMVPKRPQDAPDSTIFGAKFALRN